MNKTVWMGGIFEKIKLVFVRYFNIYQTSLYSNNVISSKFGKLGHASISDFSFYFLVKIILFMNHFFAILTGTIGEAGGGHKVYVNSLKFRNLVYTSIVWLELCCNIFLNSTPGRGIMVA